MDEVKTLIEDLKRCAGAALCHKCKRWEPLLACQEKLESEAAAMMEKMRKQLEQYHRYDDFLKEYGFFDEPPKGE